MEKLKIKLNQLVNEAGRQQDAADLIKKETGYAITQGTISRLCSHGGKPLTLHLVIYALEQSLQKENRNKAIENGQNNPCAADKNAADADAQHHC
ncbi:hypothetical protein MM188_003190 [Vibrio cholerae]|nr:hypothetical protein [Vibrio cholerae]